ncbi:hypothetical protein, partial [Frankia sp. CiP1_Cm_nod1]|uniref:hypothetical protein n=1 Tax=Frankia sp. CiP1_Cm_nod1 TaxID=2897160 RepID=UPI002024B488
VSHRYPPAPAGIRLCRPVRALPRPALVGIFGDVGRRSGDGTRPASPATISDDAGTVIRHG